MSIFEDLSKMNYVVGYQLPIHPRDYKVKVEHGKKDHTIKLTSRFNISFGDHYSAPFFSMHPIFSTKKKITASFSVDEEKSSIRLRSSNALLGIPTPIEQGKTFQVIRSNQPYLILVNKKEILVMSPNQTVPNAEDQNRILDAIRANDKSPKKVAIVFFSQSRIDK
jgi:hypothetical protein